MANSQAPNTPMTAVNRLVPRIQSSSPSVVAYSNGPMPVGGV